MSVEPKLLGSAGAIGALAGWVAARPLLVTNADAYLAGGIGDLLTGWDGDTLRLLVTPAPGGSDFGPWRFVGCSLLPARLHGRLAPRPSGLYEECWHAEVASGRAELVPYDGAFFDCGTPADYLAANLHESGGRTVVGTGAVVVGTARRCVVWPDSVVGPDEHLFETIRAESLTVAAPQTRCRRRANILVIGARRRLRSSQGASAVGRSGFAAVAAVALCFALGLALGLGGLALLR
jgi:hypothetical protein